MGGDTTAPPPTALHQVTKTCVTLKLFKKDHASDVLRFLVTSVIVIW